MLTGGAAGPGALLAENLIAIRCGRLIDGISDRPVENAVVVVRGNRIVAVGGPEVEPPT
ncbi:MAG: hypothetical protein GWN48_26035, partial [Actinobacteria bacterium]|nr:hypothetical protein [Actinomycetota bacterium]